MIPRSRPAEGGAIIVRVTIVTVGIALVLCGVGCDNGADPRLEEMTEAHPVLVLVSASGIVDGADSVCTEVIENGWQATYPANLADRTTPDRLAIGNEWLHRKIVRMSRDERETALTRMAGRVEAYQEVMSLGSYTESLATAVALTPSLVDLLPANIDRRADDPMEVGWTLASGEHAALQHGLARRLGDMQPHERASVMRGLKETAAWADSRQEGPDHEP
jgi:hypothetical protein